MHVGYRTKKHVYSFDHLLGKVTAILILINSGIQQTHLYVTLNG